MDKAERDRFLELISEDQAQIVDLMAVYGHAQADNSELLVTLIEKVEELTEEVRRLRDELRPAPAHRDPGQENDDAPASSGWTGASRQARP